MKEKEEEVGRLIEVRKDIQDSLRQDQENPVDLHIEKNTENQDIIDLESITDHLLEDHLLHTKVLHLYLFHFTR